MAAALRARDGASRRRILLLLVLALASAGVTLAVVFRIQRTGTPATANLVWNLFLAWIPLLLALVVYDGQRDGASSAQIAGVGALWLLFLPNAPYLVTDVELLNELETGALWYDAALVGAAAVTGLVLGFVSLYLVQTVVSRRLGRVAGWTFAWFALALSGVGVYLGRFLRWNSWDVFTEPGKIAGHLTSAAIDPLAHGRPLALSTAFAVAWCLGYAVFYGAFRAQLGRLVSP